MKITPNIPDISRNFNKKALQIAENLTFKKILTGSKEYQVK